MKKTLFFFTALLFTISVGAQDITGNWNGILNVQGMELPLVFHISETENGMEATMDSPSQGAYGILATSASFEKPVLKIEVANAGIAFEGKLNNEQQIEGTFKQGGMSFPLKLSQGKTEKEKIVRPQEPKEPFPYHTEDVVFKNEKADVELAGTLSLPSSTGSFPTVVLISGSGPQDRNSELMGHKPFLVLADYFTRNGIAVLRLDDRGVGASTGDFSTATTSDFATDVEAAVEFLKTKKQIDPNKIGLVGHSEGGLVAPIVANSSANVDFLILLASPGIRGDKLMLSQKEAIERKMNVPEPAVQQSKEIFRGAYEIITNSQPGPELNTSVFNYFNEQLGAGMDKEAIAQLSGQLTSPWRIEFLKNDPATALEKVKVPVLAVNGTNDLQVLSEENLSAIEKALTKGGNKNVTIKEFENLNHLFQESETGLPNEYGEIEQTFSPEAMEFLTQWILGQVK